jgi:hypothetical protein
MERERSHVRARAREILLTTLIYFIRNNLLHNFAGP